MLTIPPVVFPPPAPISPIVGSRQLQVPLEHRAPPGRGTTRIIMLVNRGGYATQPRAPGHDRPRTATRAARHGRLSAATRAPGADVPRTTTVRAPGQYWLSAAHSAPGPSRPHASTAWPVVPDRLSATFLAPGAAALRAIMAPVSGQHRLRATRIATAPRPAGQSRRRQGGLLGAAATPNTLTYPLAHRDIAHTRTVYRCANRYAQSRASGHPCPPGATGGSPGRYAPATGSACTRTPSYAPAHFTTHHVQPALQVSPGPRCCSTATTGTCRQHPARAPPQRRDESRPPDRHCGVGRNPGPCLAPGPGGEVCRRPPSSRRA